MLVRNFLAILQIDLNSYDLLKVQNVNHSTIENDFFHFSPDRDYDAEGFFVNNWTATTGELTGFWHPVFKYVIIPKPDFFSGNTNTAFYYSDLVDNTEAIEGQGPNGNPASIFENHQITQINGTLKDPSYGAEFSSLQAIENEALFGYYIFGQVTGFDETVYDFNNDGIPDDFNGNGESEESATILVILIATDKSISQLVRTPMAPINH